MPPSDNISLIKSLAQQLLHIDELGLPPDLISTLEDVVRNSRERMSKKVGEFLHDLNDTKHSEKQVKDIINVFPEALTYRREEGGLLPIQRAIYSPRSMPFVPLLAQEGSLHNVGGEENRGGLLLMFPGLGANTILTNTIRRLSMHVKGEGADEKALLILKRLRAMGLLLKEDITAFDLLAKHSATTISLQKFRLRFQYLVDWAPEALKKANVEGEPILHMVAMSNTTEAKEGFELILGESVRHFPDDFGLLFQKHNGHTACGVAIDSFGQREAMEIIKRCIPPSDNCLILHHVCVHASKYMDLFSSYYPDAIYVRDPNNRTLFQSMIAAGTTRFTEQARFFLQASDKQVAEKDPVTKLFPFALAASDDTSDLTAVYILLRRKPDLI